MTQIHSDSSHLLAAAQHGNAQAQFELGKDYFKREQCKKAWKCC
jgi:hypothetical protein